MFCQILLTNSLLRENVWGSVWRICKWILGLQRSRTTEAFLLTGCLFNSRTFHSLRKKPAFCDATTGLSVK